MKDPPQDEILIIPSIKIAQKLKQKLIFPSLIYNFELIPMKDLSPFLTASTSCDKIGQNASLFTFKYKSCSSDALVDSNLNIKIKEQDEQKYYAFLQNSYIFPQFQNKKVVSIMLYSFDNCLNITGNCIQYLYDKLARVFSHKGFGQFYKPIKRLGRGNFATVYLVQHKYTGNRMAAKVFSKQGQKIQFKGKQALENEIKTLKEIDHPNLIKFNGLYETDSLVYLVTEYLSGGTLQQTLKNKTSLSGELIQSVIHDILSGLSYLDSKQIMHRDIKPQNIILREQDHKWVIGDFGLAAKTNEEYLYDKCGTMGYIAPEIMQLSENCKYKQACDMYSLGIIAYQLIVGQLPFKVESINFFDKKLIWVMFDRQQCKDINSNILNFLKLLLDSNPQTRIKPRQALQSSFFKDQKVVNELIAFHERKRKSRYDRILKMANLN